MKMTMKLVQRLDDQVCGFSPTFTRMLVDKLKELKEMDRVVEKRSGGLYYTDIAKVAIGHLRNQVWKEEGFYTDITEPTKWEKDFDEMIAVAEEFLVLFERRSK